MVACLKHRIYQKWHHDWCSDKLLYIIRDFHWNEYQDGRPNDDLSLWRNVQTNTFHMRNNSRNSVVMLPCPDFSNPFMTMENITTISSHEFVDFDCTIRFFGFYFSVGIWFKVHGDWKTNTKTGTLFLETSLNNNDKIQRINLHLSMSQCAFLTRVQY